MFRSHLGLQKNLSIATKSDDRKVALKKPLNMLQSGRRRNSSLRDGLDFL
jgi:hypothetical protein